VNEGIIEADDLVRLAMDRLECETPGELARELGLEPYDSPKRVRRWLDGENEPDYKATMTILDRIGALDLDSPSIRIKRAS